MTKFVVSRLGLAGLLAVGGLSGCGAKAEKSAEASSEVKSVSISVANLQRRSVVRTVDVVGTLRGWEEVTVGAKKAGRVVKVLHDFGDKVTPGEILVEFDTTDAALGVQQAEARYLSDLTRLGVTRKQAENFLAKFGMGERILVGEEVEKRIREVPAVVQTQLAVERAVPMHQERDEQENDDLTSEGHHDVQRLVPVARHRIKDNDRDDRHTDDCLRLRGLGEPESDSLQPVNPVLRKVGVDGCFAVAQ